MSIVYTVAANVVFNGKKVYFGSVEVNSKGPLNHVSVETSAKKLFSEKTNANITDIRVVDIDVVGVAA